MIAKRIFLSLGLACFASVAVARADTDNPWMIEAVTVEGGPIWSHHFQSGSEDFNQHHALGIVKLTTEDEGAWGLYVLTPNSVRRTSIGAGWVTKPWTVPVSGPVKFEFTGSLGLVSGYQNYPVPLLAGEARLVLIERDNWDAGFSAAAMPYIAHDTVTNDNKAGIVATTPFLSVKYRFN
jgi:hypothetical protein